MFAPPFSLPGLLSSFSCLIGSISGLGSGGNEDKPPPSGGAEGARDAGLAWALREEGSPKLSAHFCVMRTELALVPAELPAMGPPRRGPQKLIWKQRKPAGSLQETGTALSPEASGEAPTADLSPPPFLLLGLPSWGSYYHMPPAPSSPSSI